MRYENIGLNISFRSLRVNAVMSDLLYMCHFKACLAMDAETSGMRGDCTYVCVCRVRCLGADDLRICWKLSGVYVDCTLVRLFSVHVYHLSITSAAKAILGEVATCRAARMPAGPKRTNQDSRVSWRADKQEIMKILIPSPITFSCALP